MVTRRKIRDYWTEVKRVVTGEVKQTTCCCQAPGATPKQCAQVSGNKTRCRCDCHRKKQPSPPSDVEWRVLETQGD